MSEQRNESRLSLRHIDAMKCECGHPKASHHFENTPMLGGITVGPCHATVYTELPMGMNASRCKCSGFERAAR